MLTKTTRLILTALIIINIVTMLFVCWIAQDIAALTIAQRYQGGQIIANYNEMLYRTHPQVIQEETIKWIMRGSEHGN